MQAPFIFHDESLSQKTLNKVRDPMNPKTEYHKWCSLNIDTTRQSIINNLEKKEALIITETHWKAGEEDEYEEKKIAFHEQDNEGVIENYIDLEDKFEEIEQLNWCDNSEGSNIIPSIDLTLIKKYLSELSEYLHEPLMKLDEYKSTNDKINYRYHITAKGMDFYNTVMQDSSFAQYIFYGEMCPLYDMLNFLN